jgi:hypothetical protein
MPNIDVGEPRRERLIRYRWRSPSAWALEELG